MDIDLSYLRPLDNFISEVTDEYVLYELWDAPMPMLDWNTVFSLFEKVELVREYREYSACFGEIHCEYTGRLTMTCWFKQ